MSKKTTSDYNKTVLYTTIALTAVIVVAIIAVIIGIVRMESAKATAETEAGLPQQFANGQPIVVSDLGVGTSNPDLPDLTLSFSYSCGGCVSLEYLVGEQLMNGALDGSYNLVLRPVLTGHNMFAEPATAAVLVTVAEEPEKFPAFHHALNAFSYEAMSASDSSVLGDTAASSAKIKEIARQVGISDATIDHFTDSAASYLDLSSTQWDAQEAKGRPTPATTPELVFADTVLPLSGSTADEVYQSIISSMTELGFTGAGQSN